MRNFKKLAISIAAIGSLFISMRGIKTYQSKNITNELRALAGRGFEIAAPTKFESCIITNNNPDYACTPGGVFADVLRGDLCKRGYASSVKAISAKTKDAVFSAYTIAEFDRKQYTLDRFAPINLGGTNDVQNIWPQPTKDVSSKNKVESFLFEEMCSGRITVSESQELASTNWQKVYALIK